MADTQDEKIEISRIYSQFVTQSAPLTSGQRERLEEIGLSLEQKGRAALVQQVLMDLHNAPENYSEEFLSELAALWPTNSDPTAID